MKKIISMILSSVLLLTMVLSLTACGNSKFGSISDFVNSDEFQQQLDAAMSSTEGSGLNLEITGEDNKLIYSYTYQEEMPAEAAEQLQAALEAQASTLEGIASELKNAVNVENPVVVVEYLNPDGSVLCLSLIHISSSWRNHSYSIWTSGMYCPYYFNEFDWWISCRCKRNFCIIKRREYHTKTGATNALFLCELWTCFCY